MESTERRHLQFVIQPGVIEKIKLAAERMARGAELLDEAHGLLTELRDSKGLVIAGNSIFVEGDDAPTVDADNGEVGDKIGELEGSRRSA